MLAYLGYFAYLCIMEILECIMFVVIAAAFHIAAEFGAIQKDE